ncbi:MAG: two-component system histidine kinase PnpS [Syntrophomonadaceae bacterium]|jgi:two-component system phosphate regulon sensor histidine kinase PhoR|nr:ATP-binding protein [Bacillota bacterium]HQA49584.1 ATP-binding protein [Syntrophomonadaceae bacterium]HQD90984.1 ATP-binding protein [Syntrophomonadaceae bacterium]
MLSLLKEQRHIQAILTSMVDAVFVVDAQARITLANKAAEHLFLVKEGALEGKRLDEINRDQEVSGMICQVLTSGKEVFTETTIRPSTQIFRVHVVPIKNQDDQVEAAVAVFHDVTEARNFDQMRSGFVANVSHELRTPLTSIKGFVETLLDGAMENSDTCRRFLSIIETETNRLTRLIDDLLSLSSIESKERHIQLRPVCLVRSMRGIMNIMGPQISDKELHVEFIYPQNLPRIHADEDLLGQVLINLLDNAIKYTPPKGKIIIRCRRRDSRLIITFTDTGVGIPRDSIPRVFERFYRVDKARSRHHGGTGLGLAIVKHIVESHGGEVFVDSEIGKGSTFGASFLTV